MSQNSLSHSAPAEAVKAETAPAETEALSGEVSDAQLDSILVRGGFDSVTRRRFLTLGAMAGATTLVAGGARADILDGLKTFWI